MYPHGWVLNPPVTNPHLAAEFIEKKINCKLELIKSKETAIKEPLHIFRTQGSLLNTEGIF